jgi:hypothetical protein
VRVCAELLHQELQLFVGDLDDVTALQRVRSFAHRSCFRESMHCRSLTGRMRFTFAISESRYIES